jgi:hypothetical protein
MTRAPWNALALLLSLGLCESARPQDGPDVGGKPEPAASDPEFKKESSREEFENAKTLFGERDPIVANKNSLGRSLNRRVGLLLTVDVEAE